jgi:uncharacterized protein (TIGR02246 family)
MQKSKRGSLRLWLGCAALLCACGGKAASTEQDALQVIERWKTAFKESDVDGITRLYAPDASFFGTGSQALVTAPAAIRTYFETALQRNKPRGAELLEHSVRVVSDDVVIVTGLDRVSGTKDGSIQYGNGRVTFVLERREGTWRIVHFHRSALPPG